MQRAICKDESSLLVCDVCLRSEITPVLEASEPATISLLIIYQADDYLICADCMEREKASDEPGRADQRALPTRRLLAVGPDEQPDREDGSAPARLGLCEVPAVGKEPGRAQRGAAQWGGEVPARAPEDVCRAADGAAFSPGKPGDTGNVLVCGGRVLGGDLVGTLSALTTVGDERDACWFQAILRGPSHSTVNGGGVVSFSPDS